MHPALPGLLLGARGDDDDVGVGADPHVIRPLDRRHRHELQAVVEVEHFRVQLNERYGLSLSTVVDRTAFGLNWNAPLPGGGFALANDVTLKAELSLVKAA